MSWNDLDADDLAQISYPKSESLTIRREAGPPKIYVEAKAKSGNKPMLLRMPEHLHDRLGRALSGSRSVALLAIVEEALDRLEAGQECWRVISRDIR